MFINRVTFQKITRVDLAIIVALEHFFACKDDSTFSLVC